ncbi:hypothetical protein NBRC110019_19870 [Neptunitalea chrysea]|uniref:Uncharacterized protein n=1 Tax=Neptunitalea chrysea TaxID=1647581 RepID=A0A9W6B7U2_9FLAO|nr:hypothetical protein [Neptunitalea chrysea]GLB52947.1 hypothetical protein NBRC110019_19870 [Neptunitalea chrysea]
MNHTEAEIIAIVKKLMADLDIEYLEDIPFEIRVLKDRKKSYTKRIDMETAWGVGVSVPSADWRDEDGTIAITIDDATGEIEGYLFFSAGRPIPCCARLNEEGTYRLIPIGN